MGRSSQRRLRHSGCEAGAGHCPGASCAKERRGRGEGRSFTLAPGRGVVARARGKGRGSGLGGGHQTEGTRGVLGQRGCPVGARPPVSAAQPGAAPRLPPQGHAWLSPCSSRPPLGPFPWPRASPAHVRVADKPERFVFVINSWPGLPPKPDPTQLCWGRGSLAKRGERLPGSPPTPRTAAPRLPPRVPQPHGAPGIPDGEAPAGAGRRGSVCDRPCPTSQKHGVAAEPRGQGREVSAAPDPRASPGHGHGHGTDLAAFPPTPRNPSGPSVSPSIPKLPGGRPACTSPPCSPLPEAAGSSEASLRLRWISYSRARGGRGGTVRVPSQQSRAPAGPAAGPGGCQGRPRHPGVGVETGTAPR